MTTWCRLQGYSSQAAGKGCEIGPAGMPYAGMPILCAIARSVKFMLVDKSGVAGIVGASVVSHVLTMHSFFLRRYLFAGALASWKSFS